MANVLPQPKGRRKLDMTFDLKGATSNRQRVRGQALADLLELRRPPSSFKTLLDKDWLELEASEYRHQMRLTDEEAQTLRATLAADAAFLASQRLLDYSLLVGVWLPPGSSPSSQRHLHGCLSSHTSSAAITDSFSSIPASPGASYSSTGGPPAHVEHSPTAVASQPDASAAASLQCEHQLTPSAQLCCAAAGVRHYTGAEGGALYIGLIDVLEGWTVRWQVQSTLLHFFFKCVCCNQWYNPRGITAIHPDECAARHPCTLAVAQPRSAHVASFLPAPAISCRHLT